MENSREKKGAFIVDSIMTTLLAALFYKNLVFRTVLGLSYVASEVLFYSVLIAFMTFETIYWLNREKNMFTQFVNIITPIGIYTTLAYIQDMWVLTLCVGVGVLAMNVMVFIAIWLPFNTTTKKKVIKRKISKNYRIAQSICAVGLSIISLPVLFNSIFFRSVYGPIMNYITPLDEILGVDDYIQDVRVFSNEDEWNTLDREEKLHALQLMANIYASEHGIPHELNVSFLGLNRVTLAGYHNKTYSIAFNLNYFDDLSAKEALNTLMHECVHAYQYCLVDAFKDVDKKYYNMAIIQKALKYDQEFSNYTNGYIDFDSYYNQWCESNAREDGEILTEMYLQRITWYADKIE